MLFLFFQALVSGGVDSTVCAALLAKVIYCIISVLYFVPYVNLCSIIFQ